MYVEPRSVVFRSLFLQSFWNYAKFQNIGVLHIVRPALRIIYQKNELLYKRALARNLEGFNCNPVMSLYSIGAMLKQEEKLSVCTKLNFYQEEREWRIIRASTANTAASLGDRLFWAVLKPLSLVICIFVLFAGQIQILHDSGPTKETLFIILLALISSLLIYDIPAFAIRAKGFYDGYNGTENNFYGLINLNWNKAISFLKTLGQLFTLALFAYGVYSRFKGTVVDADTIMKASLLLAFVILTIFMKKLNMPSIVLYISGTVLFALASFIA